MILVGIIWMCSIKGGMQRTRLTYIWRSPSGKDCVRRRRLVDGKKCDKNCKSANSGSIKNLSPSYLRRIFTNTSNVHSQNLRNSELNYVPRPRTESAKGSLHYRGSVLWNKIPSQIRKLPSLNVFKTSFYGKDFSNTP